MSEFGARVEAFLDEFFRLYPVAATAIGNHDHDGEWPESGEAGRAARGSTSSTAGAPSSRGCRRASCRPDDRIDRDLLVSELAAYRFDEAELREDAWDPLGYVYMIGGGIFPLLARDFAPLAFVSAPWRRASKAWPEFLPVRRPSSALWRIGRHRGCTRRWRSSSCPDVASLTDDAIIQAEAAADGSRGGGAAAAAPVRRGRRHPRDRRVRGVPSERPPAALVRRRPARAGALCPQAAPHFPERT